MQLVFLRVEVERTANAKTRRDTTMVADGKYRRTIAEQHLRALGRKHRISISWISGRNWMQRSYARLFDAKVVIPRPYSQAQYLVGLHEFGHLLGPIRSNEHTKLNVTAGEFAVVSETSAWLWAAMNVHRDLYTAIDRTRFSKLVGDALASHLWDLSLLSNGQGNPI
ncbi:MAG: hypothetical protein ACLPVY_22810 [Acidimicrobiia bacterium]